MKRIIFLYVLFATSSFSFAQKFEKQWEKVIKLETEDKIKSAYSEVKSIYSKAKKSKNEPELIKTFFYRAKYIQRLEEDAFSKIIDELENDKKTISAPGEAILDYIYCVALIEHCYKIRYERKPYVSGQSKFNHPICKWNLSETSAEIDRILANHLKNGSTFKNISLKNYEVVLDFERIYQLENKSLFEFLTEKYFELFNPKSEYHSFNPKVFENLKNVSYSPSEIFLATDFSKYVTENLFKSLQLYQLLEKEYPENKVYKLNRFLFFENHIVKDKFEFINILHSFQSSVNEPELLQKILFEKAKYYQETASKDLELNHYEMAIAILDSLSQIKKNNFYYNRAIELKNTITNQQLKIQYKNLLYSKENSRANINYKNIDTILLKVYEVPRHLTFKNRDIYSLEDIIKDYCKDKKYVAEKTYALIQGKKHFVYSTEIALPQLETGYYILVYEVKKNDKKTTSVIDHSFLTVSDFAVLLEETLLYEKFQIVHRKTGEPIANQIISLDTLNYQTDKLGFIKIDKNKVEKGNYFNSEMKIAKENDTLIQTINRNNNNYFSNSSKTKNKITVHLFSDREIYRPGQKVFVKGISIKEVDYEKSIIANTSFRVEIFDPNFTSIKEIKVKTNEFGSFNFEFDIPKNLLTGNFVIVVEEPDAVPEDEDQSFFENTEFQGSRLEFKVEEYKRPTFEVKINPTTEDYALNENVKIKGDAVMFSGAKLSMTTVKYEIYRTINYDYRFYNSYDDKIISGETETDENGNFSISFIAIPDLKIKKELLPIFNYEVIVTVTDINGETQTATSTIRLGYHSLILNASIDDVVNTQNNQKLILSSKNLNGSDAACKAIIELYLIDEFNSKFKTSSSQNIELPIITEEEFEKLFPFEKNINPANEESAVLVHTLTVNTKTEKEINLEFFKKFKPGYYKLNFFTNDKQGFHIETTRNFKVIHDENQIQNELFTYKIINEKSMIKDDFIEVALYCAVPELYFFTQIEASKNLISEVSFKVENFSKKIKIPLAGTTRKKLTLKFETYFENQFYTKAKSIDLTKKREVITIDIATMNSKFEPNSKEKWSFKVHDSNTPVIAELLASMYDQSLDKFANNQWDYHYENQWENNFNYSNRRSFYQNLSYVYFNSIYNVLPSIKLKNPSVDLFWFGFDFNSNKIRQARILYNNKKIITSTPKNSIVFSGMITDQNGMPLPGATIKILNSSRETASDFDGYFEIDAIQGEYIEASYAGYQQATYQISNQDILNSIKIILDEDELLSEVVVTGQGIKREKKALGYAITKISNEEFAFSPSRAVITELEGTIPGIIIEQASNGTNIVIRGFSSLDFNNQPLLVVDGEIIDLSNESSKFEVNSEGILSIENIKGLEATKRYGNAGRNGVLIITTKKSLEGLADVKTRKNFNETAFFYPELKTDKNGFISFEFEAPESLTQWKFRLLAHTKEAKIGYLEKSVITQKEFMIAPNLPRFLREKDTLIIPTKIINLTSDTKNGSIQLQLFDAETMEPLNNAMQNLNSIKNFSVSPNANTSVTWKIYIPQGIKGVHYKIVAKAGAFSDGEENILPVLTNSMLVTESIPLWVKGNSKKEFLLENLKNNKSTTLRNHQLTLEYCTNPTWLAIQSLPYLMEYPYECTEQTFSRFFANAIATEIIAQNPKIKNVFDSWKNSTKKTSKLNQNEELKSITIYESPWLKDAESDEVKKKNLATLFDLDKMRTATNETLEKINKKQKSNGSFAWFDNGPENEYITRYLLCGFGHLKKIAPSLELKNDKLIENAISYIDQKIIMHHQIKKKQNLGSYTTGNNELYYLYTRSFYLENHQLSDSLQQITANYINDIKLNWVGKPLYEKGLATLVLFRFGEKQIAKKIITALKETSAINEDSGMYWLENIGGWNWYQAPIETQALLIEAFQEVDDDEKSIIAMKTWLIKNKQTNNWPTTKATTEAIYALLFRGNTNWIEVKNNTIFKIGSEKIISKKLSETEIEAETGYLKINFNENEMSSNMSLLTIENKSEIPGMGGLYWQYFEELDKIKEGQNKALTVTKELLLKKGKTLNPISPDSPLNVGDIITIKIYINASENMEFVHLKDMRASAFEPIDVVSGYNWNGRLNFYKSTRDASTNFFFDTIDKGNYEIEYDVKINNKGNFSNGITTIQSMYAPEYSNHTEGIKIIVE
jgi:hypothetical protein